MRRSEDRILTTHAGSLPRPIELVSLYARRMHGEPVDAATLAAAGLEATHGIVPKQIHAGVDIGNNGEQQREGFFLYVQHRMSGFGGDWVRHPRQDVERYPDFKRRMVQELQGKDAVTNFNPPKAVGDVRYLDPAFVEAECADFRAVLDAAEGAFVEPFLTAPSPGIVAAAMKNEYYDSDDAYLDAVATALQVEYEAIAANGFLLQIDAPDLALERHLTYADRPLSAFIEFVESVIAAINRSLKNVPRDQVRLHVCWGNYEGPHDCDVPLDDILPTLLQADVGSLVLPFANPRHAHEHHCLKQHRLADDQILIAGVIDTLTNFVEHPEVVADRLQRIVESVGDRTRVIAGTDCGFDTSAGMGRVVEDVVWAKLRAMAEGARLASDRLY